MARRSGRGPGPRTPDTGHRTSDTGAPRAAPAGKGRRKGARGSRVEGQGVVAGGAGPDPAPLSRFLRGSRWRKTCRCPPTQVVVGGPGRALPPSQFPAPTQPAWDSRGKNGGRGAGEVRREGSRFPPSPAFRARCRGAGGGPSGLPERTFPRSCLANRLSGSATPPHPPLVASKSVGARPLARVAPALGTSAWPEGRT